MIANLRTRLSAPGLLQTEGESPPRKSNLSWDFYFAEKAWINNDYGGERKIRKELVRLEALLRNEERARFAVRWRQAPC